MFEPPGSFNDLQPFVWWFSSNLVTWLRLRCNSPWFLWVQRTMETWGRRSIQPVQSIEYNVITWVYSYYTSTIYLDSNHLQYAVAFKSAVQYALTLHPKTMEGTSLVTFHVARDRLHPRRGTCFVNDSLVEVIHTTNVSMKPWERWVLQKTRFFKMFPYNLATWELLCFDTCKVVFVDGLDYLDEWQPTTDNPPPWHQATIEPSQKSALFTSQLGRERKSEICHPMICM